MLQSRVLVMHIFRAWIYISADGSLSTALIYLWVKVLTNATNGVLSKLCESVCLASSTHSLTHWSAWPAVGRSTPISDDHQPCSMRGQRSVHCQFNLCGQGMARTATQACVGWRPDLAFTARLSVTCAGTSSASWWTCPKAPRCKQHREEIYQCTKI